MKRVPYTALVDKSGKIVFIGHQNQRKLDKDIARLLANRKIEGQGTKIVGAEEDAQWASNLLIPSNEIDPNIEKFAEACV